MSPTTAKLLFFAAIFFVGCLVVGCGARYHEPCDFSTFLTDSRCR